jgi:alcohol dehydrogenase class IV
MSYVLSRAKVVATAAILPWLRIPIPLSFVGADSSLALCRTIAGSGMRRVMVVTDGPLMRLGLADRMFDALRAADVEVDVFSEVEPDPGHELVLAGVHRVRSSRADAILAIGGGSPIDCAKAINLCHANDAHPGQLAGLWLYARSRRRGLPFYAVPTTAGTGSEVTMAAVVSDSQSGVKTSIIDPKLLPSAVALDPKLTTGLPPHVTAGTGMDALTHAVEAYVSSLATAETDGWAIAAVRLIVANLERAYREGGDMEAREAMLLGSYLAGAAFTRAGVGYVHAIAHQLGALYHLPHGLANAIVLPHVLEYSRPACGERLADLARAAGLSDAGTGSDALAAAFVARVGRLNAALSIPPTVDALRRADFERIVDRAFAEAHGTYGVPRYLQRQGAFDLLGRLAPAAPGTTDTAGPTEVAR